MRERIVAGNWKMNTTGAEANDLAARICSASLPRDVTVVLCPPFIWLERVGKIVQPSAVQLGAQDVAAEAWGAYTGEVSAYQVRELAHWTIIGHSERRHVFGESDATVRRKLERAAEVGLKVMLAVGETEDEYARKESQAVVSRQLETALRPSLDVREVVIAYEPVWAIGTGRPATPEYAESMAAHIRKELDRLGLPGASVPVVYGGSVTAESFAAFIEQPNLDGALVGGASLRADAFMEIIAAASHSR